MRIFLSLMITSLWISPVLGETYSWTDASGTVNFTEDYSNVPKKYRKKVLKKGDIGAQSVKSDLNGLSSGALPLQKPEVNGTIADDGLYDGKKAESWRQDFQARGAEVKRLEQQLVQLESLIKKPIGISRERVNGLPQEFKDAQKQYKEALDSYNELNDRANKAGLPAEYRK